MAAPEDVEMLCQRSISTLDDEAALDHVGALIDASQDAKFERGADRALRLLETVAKRDLSAEHGVLVEYFRANAWSVKEEVTGERNSWAWEHPAREKQILALSRALVHPGFVELDAVRRCQILTNRANQLDTMGRFIDAIEGWDAALLIIPRFAMAQGNRGYGIKHYAGIIDDDCDRAILLVHAYDGLVAACAESAIYDSIYPDMVRRQFADAAEACATASDLDRVRAFQDLDGPSLGRSKAERAYRRWCLDNRLFLNPLNDVGPYSRAASDSLVLPPITEGIDERSGAFSPPPVIGLFNQMKQEYASARFTLYAGLHDTKVHFSDLGVRLFDTLDHPAHSLAIERVRTAYRVAYSLLDKVAFTVDHYWKLGKVGDRINFKNVWMVEGKPRLLDRFKAYANWPLRGLYWLSKELFDEQLKRTTGADARELNDIRNALEHKYLQVFESWAWQIWRTPPSSQGFGLSISSDLLEAKTLRVLKIARSALIQLAMAIGVEERARMRARPETIFGPLPLYGLEDRRKRRDPHSSPSIEHPRTKLGR